MQFIMFRYLRLCFLLVVLYAVNLRADTSLTYSFKVGDFSIYKTYHESKTNYDLTENSDLEKMTFTGISERGNPSQKYWRRQFSYQNAATWSDSRLKVVEDFDPRAPYQKCISSGGDIAYIDLPEIKNVKTCHNIETYNWLNPDNNKEWTSFKSEYWYFEDGREHGGFTLAKYIRVQHKSYERNNYQDFYFMDLGEFVSHGHKM